jgi:hypothetical protein
MEYFLGPVGQGNKLLSCLDPAQLQQPASPLAKWDSNAGHHQWLVTSPPPPPISLKNQLNLLKFGGFDGDRFFKNWYCSDKNQYRSDKKLVLFI